MYSVVIVEDEQLMRDELVITTPWSDLRLELAGTACDGLAMLKACGVTHAVIISGYSDFAYMKQALQLEAFDYLLKPVGEDELERTLIALVQKLDNLMSPKNEGTSRQFGIKLPVLSDNFIARQALKIIEKRYGEIFGLQEASETLCVSESHLCRLFKESCGWNFLHYLNAYRINKSIELLQEPKNSIGEIASACGFSAAGYYTKLYRRFTGETPSQTRERQTL